MAGLTSTGFESKTLESIKADIEADLKTTISTTLNTSSDSVTGQFVGVIASQLRQVWELAEAVWGSQYPDSASGFSLTSLAALTGTIRNPATASTVLCTINVDPGTYAAGDLIAHVTDDPTSRFFNSDQVVNSGGSAVDITNVTFQCEDTGPVRANAGTLTSIAETVSGWNYIYNVVDAVLGTDEESDTALRIRRESDLAARGSTTLDAIRVDVSQVTGVTSVAVLENVTDTTDGDGLLPHSIEVLVQGGDNTEIAQAIFDGKAAGINTNGTTSETIADSRNVDHTIKFTRPTIKNVYLEVDLTASAGTYAGSTVVKDALVDYGDSSYQVGDDVIVSKLVAVVFGAAGVLDVTAIRAGFTASPLGTSNLSIGVRELADLDTARIVITATEI